MRALILVLLTACGTEYAGEDPPATAGESLYADTCARCHGAAGGGTSDAPQIADPVRPYAAYVVTNGRMDQMGFGQAMPAFDLSSDELDQIFDALDVAHPTDGQGLYLRFCGNCHGADARGGRVGEGIAGGDDDVAEKVRAGHGGTSYGARTKYMPAWTSAQLSSSEVAAIAAYLAGLPGGEHDGGGDDD